MSVAYTKLLNGLRHKAAGLIGLTYAVKQTLIINTRYAFQS